MSVFDADSPRYETRKEAKMSEEKIPPTTQLERLLMATSSGGWFTLHELVALVGGVSEAGISARARDARRLGYAVDKRPARPGSRQYLYRITKREAPDLFRSALLGDSATLGLAVQEAKDSVQK